MKTCVRCRKVKFGFQFTSEFLGLYTAVYDVCKRCVKELGVKAAREYTEEEASNANE